MNHRNVKHCFPGVGMVLIVLTQPAILPTPAERPCHDPSFGQDNAALHLVGTLDHRQAHRPIAAQQWPPRLQPPRLRAIGPEPAQAGQPMAPEAQPLLGSITLWHVGGGPHHSKEPSQGVHEAMALAPGALLGAVAPVSPTARGRGDGRRVDPPCAGLAVASCAHTEIATHDRVEPLPGAIVPPAPQGGRDQAPRRQSVGDKPPRPAGASDRQERVDALPFGRDFRPGARLGGRDQWFEPWPGGIIEIGWGGLSGWHTAILSQQTHPISTFFDTLSAPTSG